jgi:hypothetical protein
MLSRHVGAGVITMGDIPIDERPAGAAPLVDWRDAAFDQAIARALSLNVGLKEIGRAAEDTAERLAIRDAEGSLKVAAQKLKVTDRALQMRRANRREK